MQLTNPSPTPDHHLMSATPQHAMTPDVTFEFRFGNCTDTGRVRAGNEDSHCVCTNGAVVCDGLGGHNAGEVASDIACTVIGDGIDAGPTTPELFGEAVQLANTTVYLDAQNDPRHRGMGTTAVALTRLPGDVPRVAVANTGDSRAYLYRTGDFVPVTTPHNVAQQLIDGGMDPAEAHARWDAHMLTDAIGLRPEARVDVTVVKVEPGDRFLLASDGLTDMVSEEDIAEVLWRHRDPQVCAGKLVALANERGGIDNITVVVADVVIAATGGPA